MCVDEWVESDSTLLLPCFLRLTLLYLLLFRLTLFSSLRFQAPLSVSSSSRFAYLSSFFSSNPTRRRHPQSSGSLSLSIGLTLIWVYNISLNFVGLCYCCFVWVSVLIYVKIQSLNFWVWGCSDLKLEWDVGILIHKLGLD